MSYGRVAKIRPGTGVHALRPGELSIDHELLGELMLQFREHGVIVSVAAHAPIVPAADLRVEGETRSRGNGKRVLMEENVIGHASLVSERRHELVTQIVLNIRGVVMRPHRRQGVGKEAGEDLHVGGACYRQTVYAKAGDRIRVRGKAVKVVYA